MAGSRCGAKEGSGSPSTYRSDAVRDGLWIGPPLPVVRPRLVPEQFGQQVAEVDPPDLVVVPVPRRLDPLVADALGRERLVQRPAAADGGGGGAAAEPDELELLVRPPGLASGLARAASRAFPPMAAT
jgi:hypothetical protein